MAATEPSRQENRQGAAEELAQQLCGQEAFAAGHAPRCAERLDYIQVIATRRKTGNRDEGVAPGGGNKRESAAEFGRQRRDESSMLLGALDSSLSVYIATTAEDDPPVDGARQVGARCAAQAEGTVIFSIVTSRFRCNDAAGTRPLISYRFHRAGAECPSPAPGPSTCTCIKRYRRANVRSYFHREDAAGLFHKDFYGYSNR